MSTVLQILLSVISATVGAACLQSAYLALGKEALPNTHLALSLLLVVAGLGCLFGSLAMLRRLFARARIAPPQQFGRHGQQVPRPRSVLPIMLSALTAAAVGALAIEWSIPPQIIAPELPRQDSPPSSDTTPAAISEEQAAIAPATPPPPPEPEAPAPSEPASPPASPPPSAAAPAPPATSAIVPQLPTSPPAPTTTTVPLPTPTPAQTDMNGHRDAVIWLALSADGKSVLSASSDMSVKLWDLPGERLIRTVATAPDIVRVASFLPAEDRIIMAADDGEIVVRKLEDGSILQVLSAKDHGRVNKIAVTPDGRRMVSGHQAGTVLMWDLEAFKPMHVERAHGWPVAGVAISEDGRLALSGSIDGDLKLWNVESGDLVRYWGGHERGSYGIAFLPDGKRAVTGSGDRTIKLWDLETGREIRRFEGHAGTVYAIALSADGTRILSGSLDGTARLWDLENGGEIALYAGHRGAVYSVAFGPDGTVLTGSNDRTIRVWPERGGGATTILAGAPN